MTAAEWVNLGIQAVILVGAVLVIRNDSARLRRDHAESNAKLNKKIDTLTETVTNMRLALKDCVTWEELVRELGPIRVKGEDHERRLGVIETKCEQRHGGK